MLVHFVQAISSIIAVLVLLYATPLMAGVTAVWAVNDGEKIFRYEAEHPARDQNSVWDGRRIGIRGLYNEVVAFQVIVEADSLGAEAVEVAIAPPVHQSSGRAIGASGPAYGPGGSLEIFSEHYIEVRRPTKPQWFYGSEESAPERMTGWIPDPLIPPDARPGRGGFPVDIPPTERREERRQNRIEVTPRYAVQNQGFWVDVYLPRDREYPAGTYTSTVTVTSGGKTVAEVPFEVELLRGYLPDENHSNIWLYGSVGTPADYLQGIPRDEVEKKLKFISHRHRIDFVGGSNAHRNGFDERMMNDYLPWLDGSAFTPANGYHGPGQASGEKLFPVGMYGSITRGPMGGEQSARAESDRWVRWFETNAPDVTYFWYLIDEPGEVQFPWIIEHANWVQQNPGPGNRLPVFTTRMYTPGLSEVIDIWAGHNGVDLEMLPELQAAGKDHWFYNGNRPRYGSVILEAEAVDFTVNGWVKYIHGVNTWFLWESTHWQHNFQGPKGHLHQRVFTEPLTFISWGMSFGNGDGIVFYPGRMPFYPEEDRGLNRVLGSIRLKSMRRGQQDYELMWLAAQKAGREKVLELVREVVPVSLEADMEGPVHWSQQGDDYDRVRRQLQDMIVGE